MRTGLHWLIVGLYCTLNVCNIMPYRVQWNWLQNKQIPCLLVRKQTIPAERQPLVGEVQCQILWIEGCRVVSAADPISKYISY
jgi:hypothetical protein